MVANSYMPEFGEFPFIVINELIATNKRKLQLIYLNYRGREKRWFCFPFNSMGSLGNGGRSLVSSIDNPKAN